VVGFQARRGKLEHELVGRVPFQFSPPNFVPESCAMRLLIKIAIADICSVKRPQLDPEKVNLWIPDNGSAIATGRSRTGRGHRLTRDMTVNRSLASNPLPAECSAGVGVTPSAAQIAICRSGTIGSAETGGVPGAGV
jgi:hypothetical protein